MELGLGPGDFALMGTQFPSPKKGAQSPPNFEPMSVVAKWLDGSRCHLVQRLASAKATVLAGHLVPPKKGGTASQFLTDVYCGEMVARLSYC